MITAVARAELSSGEIVGNTDATEGARDIAGTGLGDRARGAVGGTGGAGRMGSDVVPDTVNDGSMAASPPSNNPPSCPECWTRRAGALRVAVEGLRTTGVALAAPAAAGAGRTVSPLGPLVRIALNLLRKVLGDITSNSSSSVTAAACGDEVLAAWRCTAANAGDAT
mmetsp:Transcript_18978/g.47360  ORF Transcript_18978/g.47360 Transcript_18978/m.47360 type:complete len:167 (-) Transcript_18978:792-1292(-)